MAFSTSNEACEAPNRIQRNLSGSFSENNLSSYDFIFFICVNQLFLRRLRSVYGAEGRDVAAQRLLLILRFAECRILDLGLLGRCGRNRAIFGGC